MAQVTHCYGESFVLGVVGTFANATVSVDEAGTVTTQALTISGSGTEVGIDPVVEDVSVVDDVAQEQPTNEVVEESVPPVQTVMGG